MNPKTKKYNKFVKEWGNAVKKLLERDNEKYHRNEKKFNNWMTEMHYRRLVATLKSALFKKSNETTTTN